MRPIQKAVAFLLMGITLLHTAACSGLKKANDSQNTIKITLSPRYTNLESVLETEFPDIRFEFEHYTGPASTEYLRTQLMHDDAGDIFLSTLKFDDITCKEHLMDISGYNFVGNYESSLLNQYDVDGAIYMLPGPVIIRSMVYNKTLFEEKGWQAPSTHGQLVDLVRQIRAESDMTPIAFGAKGLGYYFTTMTTFAQTAYLMDVHGQEWEQAYLKGDISCKAGFQPGIDMLQQLIDADAYDIELDSENWDVGAIQRMIDREAAMVAIWGSQENFVDLTEDCTDEFVLFPFYSENGDPLLGTHVSPNIGLTKHLEKPENKGKLENATRILEWLSTPEGMANLNVGMADILPLTAADNQETAKTYRDVWETNLSGMKAPMLYAGYEDVLIQASEFIRNAMIDGKSLDGLVELIDNLHQAALAAPEEQSLGSVSERFSHEETVQLVANALHTAGLADITMASSGGRKQDAVNYKGVSGKLYEGNLYITDLPIWMPGNESNAYIEVMELTGEQIRSAVETGKTIQMEGGNTADFEYYWAGMRADIIDGKVNTMQLDNGTEITADRVYSVAFAKGDYTEALKNLGNPVAQSTYCLDLFKAYLADNTPLTPPELSR